MLSLMIIMSKNMKKDKDKINKKDKRTLDKIKNWKILIILIQNIMKEKQLLIIIIIIN